MFSKDELRQLLILTNAATITGKDAATVVMLQQKIINLLKGGPVVENEPRKKKTK